MQRAASTLSSADRKILNFIGRAERSKRHTTMVKELNRQAQRGILPPDETIDEVEPEPINLLDELHPEVEEQSEEEEQSEAKVDETPTSIELSDIVEAPPKKEATRRYPRLYRMQLFEPVHNVEPDYVLPQRCSNFVPHPRRWLVCEHCGQLIRSDQTRPTLVCASPAYYHTRCLQKVVDSRHF